MLHALDVDLFILDMFLKAVITASGRNPLTGTVVYEMVQGRHGERPA